MTTHNIHDGQTSMPPAGFEPAIPASEWPQTHALDHSATGIGTWTNRTLLKHKRKLVGILENQIGALEMDIMEGCCYMLMLYAVAGK